jgi:hypothetical protein
MSRLRLGLPLHGVVLMHRFDEVEPPDVKVGRARFDGIVGKGVAVWLRP